MVSWNVTLDLDGRWHCHQPKAQGKPTRETAASRFAARNQAASWVIDAPSRGRALTIARDNYDQRLRSKKLTRRGRMNRTQFDELYHLLRVVSNEASENKDPELSSIITGMAKHLLEGGNYLNLIQYSAYYGREFLVEPTHATMKAAGWAPQRIVEFGAGLGWLGRGLADKFDLLPTLFVDKRHWVFIDIVADLETEQGLETVSAALKPGDVIVMSDFLHCIDKPEQLLQRFADYPIVVLEYGAESRLYEDSFNDQLKRYGGNPIPFGMLRGMLESSRRGVKMTNVGPYTLALLPMVTGE